MTVASPAALLANEQQLLDNLTSLLEQEQALLIAADAEALAALTPRKQHLVQGLSAAATARHQMLGAAGFAAGEDGMAPWLAAQQDPSLSAAWAALLDQTRQARDLNRLNGSLIQRQMTHNQQALAALRAAGVGAAAQTYGPSGETINGGRANRYVLG